MLIVAMHELELCRYIDKNDAIANLWQRITEKPAQRVPVCDEFSQHKQQSGLLQGANTNRLTTCMSPAMCCVSCMRTASPALCTHTSMQILLCPAFITHKHL